MAGMIGVLSACTKTVDTTSPAGPMTASFTKTNKPTVSFIASHLDPTITPNAAYSYHHYYDSTLTLVGRIYKPNTVVDSNLQISITIFKYKAFMGGIGIDNDTLAYASLIDSNGAHIASEGNVSFGAATAYGATGTFNFKCADNTVVNSGWFEANWR